MPRRISLAGAMKLRQKRRFTSYVSGAFGENANPHSVIPGLDPGIHNQAPGFDNFPAVECHRFSRSASRMDPRVKPWDDGGEVVPG
ncbi:hypothetical protein [Rhizobium binae]|uniref:hypothetical protein n=1 Tax=Rhizobium binae TaxID=1138190 RepID=UPI001C834753|nr:hypothetical protein [Rhizobium binae]MBX4967429.1 hypothetical protein [Rhizobium binae]